VTEMHAVMLQALSNQHEEMENLKQLVAEMRGVKFTRWASKVKTNVRPIA